MVVAMEISWDEPKIKAPSKNVLFCLKIAGLAKEPNHMSSLKFYKNVISGTISGIMQMPAGVATKLDRD